MTFGSKIDMLCLLAALLVTICPLSINSFMVDTRVRAKLKEMSKTTLTLASSLQGVAGVVAGPPLLLSPLIEKGDIAQAEKEATVTPMLPGVESFAGYITVNKTTDSNMFFWLFKSLEGDWKTKPVIIWLQGGPGVSSMLGLFREIGPFSLDKHGKLTKRKYAWNQKYNLMFIDNPVGTGFSFTKQKSGYATTETDVARDLYSFIVQFYGMFPGLVKNQLFIMGESYAGKYVPAFSHYIHQRNLENKAKAKSLVIPLAAVAIGNGFSDQLYMVYYADFLYQLGFVDQSGRDKIRKFEEQAVGLIKAGKFDDASQVYGAQIFDAMYNLTGLATFYNYINDDVKIDGPEEAFLIKPETRKALHVGNQQFTVLNDDVYEHLQHDEMRSVKPLIEDILNWEAFDFVAYTGALDIICGYPLSENLYYNLKWKHADAYKTAKRCRMGGKENVGYFKTAGVFTEIMFRSCGHLVPTDCPEAAFNFLDMFITNRKAFKCV